MKSLLKLLAIYLLGSLMSCSASSAVSDDLHADLLSDSYAYLSPEDIVYASSISNLISTFPKFRNDAVNREVGFLKEALSDYLNSVRQLNEVNKKKSIEEFEKSYKKIQKLRKFMTSEDDEVLNRYMVKIKTNINLLEASQSKNVETSSMSAN